MWGNLHGWLISAVLAVVILAPIAWLGSLSRMAAPTGPGADPANFAKIALPAPPREVWPIFTEDSDAADLYRKVIDAWTDDAESASEQFVHSPEGRPPQPLQWLAAARHCQRMELFSKNPALLINYDSDHPDLEKLFAAGQWACKAGLSLQLHGHTPEAKEYLEASFALGRQFYIERMVYDEYQKGATLMADASTGMCTVLPRGSELYDRLSDFQKLLSDYQDQHVQPIWQVISTADQSTIEQTAGDVAAFAEQSSERMWRVEATLKLGRYRYDAGTLGDQLGASRILRRLIHDPDPAVSTAATAARALTLENYRMIH